MKNLQLLALLSILFFSACSTVDDEVIEDAFLDGNFEATLSGDISKNFNGEATFVHAILTTKSEFENGSSLAISLMNEDDEDELITILVGQIGDLNGIDKGTYNVNLDAEDGDPLVNIGAFLTGSSGIFVNESGSVTLTKIGGNTVEGTFTAQLTNFNGTTTKVSGEFTAKGITENI